MRQTYPKPIRVMLTIYSFVVLAWVVCGCAIGATILHVGGSPGLGRVDHGHYFVGMHGHYAEVSAAFFNGFAAIIKWEEFAGLLLGAVSAPVLMCVWLKRAWNLAKEEFAN